MSDLGKIADSLVNKDATVSSVAEMIGALGGKSGAGYDVHSSDPRLTGAYIAIRRGLEQNPSATPGYVDLYFSPSSQVSLSAVIPSCKQWRQIPNSPHGSPYLYACDFERSSATVRVIFYAELTGGIDAPHSHLKKIMLQRNIRSSR